MNKRDLIDAISGRLGDKKTATEALNAVLEAIQSAVAGGDKVAITGFGVFEKSERPARTARNPATGAEIQVAASSVPKFRPGADFKALVNGNKAEEKPAAKPAARTAGKKKLLAHRVDGRRHGGHCLRHRRPPWARTRELEPDGAAVTASDHVRRVVTVGRPACGARS